MVYLNHLLAKAENHSTVPLIVGEDVMEKFVLGPCTSQGHNCIHSSGSLQGPISNAMIMSRVITEPTSDLIKAIKPACVRLLCAAGEAALEAGIKRRSSEPGQPAEELHASSPVRHRVALKSHSGNAPRSGQDLLKSYKRVSCA